MELNASTPKAVWGPPKKVISVCPLVSVMFPNTPSQYPKPISRASTMAALEVRVCSKFSVAGLSSPAADEQNRYWALAM